MSYSYRRSQERFSVEVSAEVSTDKAKGISGILTDLSSGGAGLITNVPFDSLEEVELLIKPCYLFREDVKRKARVAWCQKSGYNLWKAGLNFGIDNLINFS